MTTSSSLPRSFYQADSRIVAAKLLNKVFVGPDGRSGRIVEVEAYRGSDDPAAHSFNGRTKRNATMFGPAGHMYVYFTYGMHWCANAVCGESGVAEAVLIRALEPLVGLDRMRELRPKAKRDTELCSGPARLAQAMSITGANDGADLVQCESDFRIVDDGTPPPNNPGVSPRIGIRNAADFPWRWYVIGNLHVSKGKVARRQPGSTS